MWQKWVVYDFRVDNFYSNKQQTPSERKKEEEEEGKKSDDISDLRFS